MTETTTTPPTPVRPSEILLHILVFLLAPMFLTTSDGDIAFARAAALETIQSYQARNNADLITIAQIIAYGLTALGSLSLSMEDNLSLAMTIRLRANAATMTRSAEQSRRALRESGGDTARPNPPETPFTETDQAYEASVLASVAAARTSTANCRAQMHTAEPSPPTTGPTLFEQALTLAQAPIEQPPSAQPETARQRQAMWAAAMIDVAGEYTAELQNLPPAQRRAASMRAAALSTTAHNLISGAVPPQSGPGALASLARQHPT